MEAPKEPDKCKQCAGNLPQDEDECYQCELCKEVLYCSDECETANFLSHRDSCKGQDKVFAMQKQCFTCTKRIGAREEHCVECGRVKYCSVTCKEADKKNHDLICGAYAGLGPRPSNAHRICIFFPAEEEKPRLIWVSRNHRDMRDLIAPEGFGIEVTAGPHVDFDDETNDYRSICFVSIDGFFNHPRFAPNQSLGLATVGRPLRSVRGPLLIIVSECSFSDGCDRRSDVIPGDLLPVLQHFEEAEAMHGRGIAGEVHGYSHNSEGDLVLENMMRFFLPGYMR